MVNFLLARNADPQSEDKNGRTAADIAKLRGETPSKLENMISNICSNSRLQQNRTDSFTMRQYELKKYLIFSSFSFLFVNFS